MVVFNGFLVLVNCCLVGLVVGSTPNGNRILMVITDGMVYDFENYASMPNLNKLMMDGIRADRMIPTFPTKTWPSITSLMTGLYTESHGIILNEFLDVRTGKMFRYEGNKASSYFKDEPIWMSNQKQGGKAQMIVKPNKEPNSVEKVQEPVSYRRNRL